MSVYVFGSNKYGELGSCKSSSLHEPRMLDIFDGQSPIIACAAGEGHSLCVSGSGDVYSFGRGHDGQLGLGKNKTKINIDVPTLIAELQHESIVNVCAGAVSSYAISANGRVYQWGLVHKQTNLANDDMISGQLTGLAQDETNAIEIDNEAREAYSHINSSSRVLTSQNNNRNRQLRDIIQDSTEEWMMAKQGADDEFFNELNGNDKVGLENDPRTGIEDYPDGMCDTMTHDRKNDYSKLLRTKCNRTIQPIPQVIESLRSIKISGFSAGYSHCVAISDNGVMLSCGYNDRGQLGLGHRISTSSFQVVESLVNQFVVQVCCGQQHTLCRAISRSNVSGVYVGSNSIGCNVYACGNGVLGQLGLGVLGTSRGRLYPALMTTLREINPLGAIDISAGDNFSVAVLHDGKVYSWGHGQYNQHGTGAYQGSDYVDNFQYFIPNQVIIKDATGNNCKITRVRCGSNFTVAITEECDAYSWGWNAYGALGQGKGYIPATPSKVVKVGKSNGDRSVMTISAGSNHVLCITSSSSNIHARSFRSLLDSSQFSDMNVVDEVTGRKFPCHRAILSARCKYLKGYLKAALQDGSDNIILDIYLPTESANVHTIEYLLSYIYTDSLIAPKHMWDQMYHLANFVGIPRLAQLCLMERGYSSKKKMKINTTSHHYHKNALLQTDSEEEKFDSMFESDILALVGCDDHADIKFRFSCNVALNKIIEDEVNEFKSDDDAKLTELIIESDMNTSFVDIYAHRVLLSKFPYFECLFSDVYQDGKCDENGVQTFYMDSFEQEDISVDTFRQLLQYAYSGTQKVVSMEDSNQLMALLVASNRIGIVQLSQLCEKTLSLHLTDFPENITNCYEFAQIYNFQRLARQCYELLHNCNDSKHHLA